MSEKNSSTKDDLELLGLVAVSIVCNGENQVFYPLREIDLHGNNYCPFCDSHVPLGGTHELELENTYVLLEGLQEFIGEIGTERVGAMRSLVDEWSSIMKK